MDQTRCDADDGRQQKEVVVVPVIEEKLDVYKRAVVGGGVRIHKIVHEREELVDIPLTHEDVHVERVSINRIVEGAVEVRQEGDTTIVPVVEEVLVVERRLLLKEELRITRRRSVQNETRRVLLRSEEAVVEPLAPPPAGAERS